MPRREKAERRPGWQEGDDSGDAIVPGDRLIERGVRFVELSCISVGVGAGNAPNLWDQHGSLKRGHGAMAHQVDQPIAALLTDLKARGLLDETLVLWAGEFGRTPFSQGSDGRDHIRTALACGWRAA